MDHLASAISSSAAAAVPRSDRMKLPTAQELPKVLAEAREGADRIIAGLQAGKVDQTFTKWAMNGRSEAGTVMSNIRLRLVLSEQPDLFLEGAERAMVLFASAIRRWSGLGWIGDLSDMADYSRMGFSPLLQDIVQQTSFFRYMPKPHCKRMFIILLDICIAFVEAYYSRSASASHELDPDGISLMESSLTYMQAFYSANPSASQEAFDELQTSQHATDVFGRLQALVKKEFTPVPNLSRTLLQAHPIYIISSLTALMMQQMRVRGPLNHANTARLREIQAMDDPEERCRAVENEITWRPPGEPLTTPGRVMGRTYRSDPDYLSVCVFCAACGRGAEASKRFKPCSACGMATYCGQSCIYVVLA